jgi:hypothetical protein
VWHRSVLPPEDDEVAPAGPLEPEAAEPVAGLDEVEAADVDDEDDAEDDAACSEPDEAENEQPLISRAPSSSTELVRRAAMAAR